MKEFVCDSIPIERERERAREGWQRMGALLCDAAIRGDSELLHEIIAQDNYILDKVLMGCFKGKNPLHLATSTGQAEFVLRLLEIKPKLAEVVDSELGAALHLASANGDLKIVEALVEVSPEMCMARDRNGNNPLHIAAMKGKVDVLEKLVQTCPLAPQVILDQGDTILHLCVNHNQLESLRLLLEMTIDPNFVHSTDANGNTILHIAVLRKRFEIVEHLLQSTKISLNAMNGAGWTAMDINFFVLHRVHKGEVDDQIRKCLHAAGAKRSRQILATPSPMVKELLEIIMVVASLFATMAFQVGVNPPGGVWQDDGKDHQAGEAILASRHPERYRNLMYFNTVGFHMSLTAILVLMILAVPLPKTASGWILPVMSLLTILTTAYAYTYSIIVLSPKHIMAGLEYYSLVAAMAGFLMSVGFVLSASALERWRTKKEGRRLFKAAGKNVSSTV